MIPDVIDVYISKAVDTIENNIYKMKNTLTNKENAEKFVNEIIRYRHGEDVELFSMSEILTPKREEDRERNAWNIYNLVQEKVVNGDYHIIKKEEGAEPRKARKMNSAKTNYETNKVLHNLAMELL